MAVHPNSKKNLVKGRKKGQKNKFTTNLKQAYLEAFETRGGVQGLLDWAKKNPDGFYSQISKMLPKNLEVGVTIDDVLGALPPEIAGPVREALSKHISKK